MAARREKSKRNAPIQICKRKASLVPIKIGELHSKSLTHLRSHKAPNSCKGGRYHIPLKHELRLIVKMHEGASAATPKMRAFWFCAAGAFYGYGKQFSYCIAGCGLYDMNPYRFSRQRKRHKHGKAIISSDALTFRAKCVNGQLDFIIAFQGRCFLWHKNLLFAAKRGLCRVWINRKRMQRVKTLQARN